MTDKVTWKPPKSTSVQDFEAWISEMGYEPYVYDPMLQSISWAKDLTAAIKKVEPLVGEGKEIEYLYWGRLRSWQFILNSFSIARVLGGIRISSRKANWKEALDELRSWVDSGLNNPRTKDLFLSGTSFFYDMTLFFNENRKLCDPKKLAREVLEHKL